MMTQDYSKEFEMIAKAYEKSGGNVSNLLDGKIASVIISGNKVIGLNNIEGVKVVPRESDDRVKVQIVIEDNIKPAFPIHVCTGYIGKEGKQIVELDITVGNGAKVNFISHCSFPWGENFTHEAFMNFKIGKGAFVKYEDQHFHGEKGINMISITRAVVEEGGKFYNSFEITKTRVGRLKVEMSLWLKENSSGELLTKIKGMEDDLIDVREVLHLDGEGAKGLAKSTVIALDRTKANVVNEAYGNAPNTKGHVECEEITKGEKVEVSTTPILKVRNDRSELTHEASIGRVNQKQLETLMAKGLTEEEATDFIIRGLI